MKFHHLLLAAATVFAPLAPAAESPATPPPAAEKARTPKLPWHMINLWWKTAGAVQDFSEFAIDVDISTAVPSDKYNLYISPFCGSINGSMFYGGIQSNCNGWNAAKPEDQKRLHGGPGFIFSRWSDKPDLTLGDVRATPGGFVEAAGYEGNFVSGRRPYPWTAGKYTFSLRRMDTQWLDGKAHTWVGAFVHEHTTGKNIFVNALRFPGESLVYNGSNAAFLEFYQTSEISKAPVIADLPPLEVKFSNYRVNGAPADLKAVDAKFIREEMKRADKLDTPISPNLVRVTASEDGREITCRLQNTVYADHEEPSRRLWPAAK